jgi:pimeloyl-ACP methyl ester carboxylesterase
MLRRVFCVALLALAFPGVSVAQSASFDSNGVAINYTDRGQGIPVVLIHGFTGSYARHFDRSGVMLALENAGYRVIALDCRGHGGSGKPMESRQYGLEQVQDVLRLLDHLSIARAHIVGYSMGGAIATQILTRYPNRALTVTLIGAGWEGEDLRPLTSEMQAMADGFDHRDATGLLGAVSGSGQGGSGLSQADLDAATADLFARNDPALLATIARGLPELWEVPRAALARVTTPVLAIDGDQDRNLVAAQRMATIVKGLELVVLPGATHASSVRPSAPYIVAFLNRHRP